MGSRNFTSERGVTRLLEDLQSLLDDGKTGDTVFLIGLKEIPIRCHSFILRTRCKSFRSDIIRYPEISPEMFRAFLSYVYTGKLSVEENSVFELFCLAGEFGMDDLERTCEELLCTHLDTTSSYLLLNAGLAKIKKGNINNIGGHINSNSTSTTTTTTNNTTHPINGNTSIITSTNSNSNNSSMDNSNHHSMTSKGLNQLIERCITWIGENPVECLQSSRFLSLPMDTLVAVISSDQLCLEEEEVWHCVLRWAQFQANVETHVSRWTEEERLKVAKYLSPVISHVRLLLIDSRVFAEEIEPTGCVPMALSLERYRFAALPNQFTDGDPRLTPRNAPRLFQASAIIQSERVILGRKLNEWYGHCKQSWRCIFRASHHGFSADAFHTHCDGLFPTYVVAIIKNTKWICGGFADVPWTRSKTPRYAASNKAFLFCYDGNSSSSISSIRPQPVKFSIVKKHFALCHDSNSGPIFGAGADLCIASMCNENSESYSNLPHSYESDGGTDPLEGVVLTPTYTFTIADYEVFVPHNPPPSLASSTS